MEFLRNHQLNIMLVLIGVCGVLALLVLVSKNIAFKRKFSLAFLEISSALLLTFDRFAYIYRGDTSSLGWWMVRISNFLVFFLSLACLVSFNFYLKDLYRNEGGLKKTPLGLILSRYILALAMILLVIAQFTGLYYTFDSENRYQRSPGYIICYILPVIVIVIQAITILKYRNRIRRKIFIPIFLFTVIPICATVLQLFMYGLSLTNISIVGMTIMLYVFALNDLNESLDKAHKREVELLAKYNDELEKTVEKRTQELLVANEKAENLLLNILPKDIAKELTEHPGETIANEYPNATVLFTDIVNFTQMSGNMTAFETVNMLNQMTQLFDERAKADGIEKIKTIGDAYMAVTGFNDTEAGAGAVKMIRFAKGILEDVKTYNKKYSSEIKIRVGINTGSLVGGVIGKTKFIYDVWGDTVNVASRMESTGKPMMIHVTEKTYNLCRDAFSFGEPEQTDVKGKGIMKTYFL